MTDRDILSFDPWGDSKGDDPYRVLRNVMVVARVPSRGRRDGAPRPYDA
jgi:hypothetical protein